MIRPLLAGLLAAAAAFLFLNEVVDHAAKTTEGSPDGAADRAVPHIPEKPTELPPSLPFEARDGASFVEAGPETEHGADYLVRDGGVAAAVAGRTLWIQLAAPRNESGPAAGARVAVRFGDGPSRRPEPGVPSPAGAASFRGTAGGVAPAYRTLTLRDVAKDVDVELRGDGGALRFDVRLAAGAELSAFRARVEGAEALCLADGGNLVASTAAGDLRFGAPIAYAYGRDGSKDELPCRFVLGGDFTFGFEVDGRDPEAPLVVDPVLSYASYAGGSGADAAFGVASAGTSEVYVVGETASSDFPLTPGAFDASLAAVDAFVTRLNYSGATALFSTYLGGSGHDRATGVAVAADGAVYVCGFTDSPDFPTTSGALAGIPQGGRDAFVCRLSADGTQLLTSGLLGGVGADEAEGLALLPDGGLAVVGSTSSASFPTGAGPTSAPSLGGDDAFAVRLAPGGGSIVWARRYGGSAADAGYGVAVDAATGDVFIGGAVASNDFPTTPGVWIPAPAGGVDGFVARAASVDGAVVFATRVGGGSDDVVRGVASDGVGGVAAAGATDSADFPITFGTLDPSPVGEEAFVVLLDEAGATPQFSTFLGGSGADGATAISVDVYGAVHVVGRTTSADFDASRDGHLTGYGGLGDGFYAKLDATGSSLDYGTYLGGGEFDAAHALTTDAYGGVFAVGVAGAGFATSAGAFDETYGGGGDAFVFAIVFCFAKPSVFQLGGGCGPATPPILGATPPLLGQFFSVDVAGAPPGAPGELLASVGPPANLSFGPCTAMVNPFAFISAGSLAADAAGNASLTFFVTPESFCCGLELVFQALVFDAAGLFVTNGVRVTIGG